MMGAPKMQKVEIRTRSGAPFNRAGERWSGDFRDVPVEIVKDAAKMKILSEDPNIEIRVDGEYITGPRAGTKTNAAPSPVDEGVARRVESLERQLKEADREIDRLKSEIGDRGRFFDELAARAGVGPTASPTELLAHIEGLAKAPVQGATSGGEPALTANPSTDGKPQGGPSVPPPAPTTPDGKQPPKK